MGAFNTKAAPPTEKGATNDVKNESSNSTCFVENAVSEIDNRNGPEILDDRKPHGMRAQPDCIERVIEKGTEQSKVCGYKEIGVDVESKKIIKQSTPVPNNWVEDCLDFNFNDCIIANENNKKNTWCDKYLDTNCKDGAGASEDVKNTHLTVSMLKPESIRLKSKEELISQDSGNVNSSVMPIIYIPNPYASDVAKNGTVQEITDFMKKYIKQELIEENVDLIENSSFKKIAFQYSDEDNLLSKNFFESGTEKLMGEQDAIEESAENGFEQKVMKQEFFEENVKKDECNESKHYETTKQQQQQTTKWIINPLALISSIKKDIPKERLTENKKMNKSISTKLIVNPFASSDQISKLTDVKFECQSPAAESEVDRFSDYQSLCNTSFGLLPQITNDVGPENSKNAESLIWMVKVPESPPRPNKNNEMNSAINQPKKKRKTGTVVDQTSEIKFSKSKQTNKTKPKICRKTQPRRKFSQRSKTNARVTKNIKRPMQRRGRRRMSEADKTYSCPFSIKKCIKHAANCRRRLRARTKDNLTNKQILLFPKPLWEEKPQIVSPPAPIQIKTIKSINDFDTYEPMLLANQNQFDEKNELDYLRNADRGMPLITSEANESISQLQNELKSEFNEPFIKLEKSLKTEVDYDVHGKSISYALPKNSPHGITKSLNVKGEVLPTSLEPNCKLLQLLQPKVCVKRLPLSATNVKDEHCTQLAEHLVTQKNFETTSKLQLKSECARANAVAAPLFDTNLQQGAKFLQSLQPKVCLKRFPLPTDSTRAQLYNTCCVKIKREPITNSKVEIENHKMISTFKTNHSSAIDLQNNLKLLHSMQPKVRLKRLNFHDSHQRSPLADAKHAFEAKRAARVVSIPTAFKLQPIVRLRRLNFADYKCNQNLENHNQQLKVDLEVKRERNFYETNAAYACRKRNMCSMRIKEEKLSTPALRIDQAFSLQPLVRIKRLKCAAKYSFNQIDHRRHSNCQTIANAMELERQVKMECFDVDEEQLTPISFATQYEEEDSGVSLDSAHNLNESFEREAEDEAINIENEHDINAADDILFEIALQRACINDLLLRHGYSPIQFRLYNNLEELKIFLDYLLVE